MRTKFEVGRIVWHDLLTHDVAKAKQFYTNLLGWQYQIEHTTDFVWASGEAEYPLIVANGEAHGGFVEPGQAISSHWVAFVMVQDVDAIAAKAKQLGATLDRAPFDVPGVGRSAVIRDPQGAITCPYRPTHHFPPPRGLFLWDELMTHNLEPEKIFYSELYGWTSRDVEQPGTGIVFNLTDGNAAAGAIQQPLEVAGSSTWVTYLAIHNIDATITQAKTLGANVYRKEINRLNMGRMALLTDPTGAVFGLLSPSE